MINGVVNTDILGANSGILKVKKSFADNNQAPLFSMKKGGTGFESQFANASSSFERAQSVASSRGERALNSLMKVAKHESEVNNLFRDIKSSQAKMEDLENCIKSAQSGTCIGSPQMAEMSNAQTVDVDEKLSVAKNTSTVDKLTNIEIQQSSQGASTGTEGEKQKINNENEKYNNKMAGYSEAADQKKAEFQATIKDAVAMLIADYAYEKAQLTVNEDLHAKKSEKTADIKKGYMINDLASSQANNEVQKAETRMVNISSLAEKEAEGSTETPKADTKQSATPVETGSTDKDQKGKNPFGVTV